MTGRPLLYQTPEEMEQVINEYFDHCDNRIRQVYSKKTDSVVEIIDPEPYTIAGLAYALGMDRRSLLNYAERDNFFLTVKRAREKVQLDVERRLMEGQTVGAIFNLKNNFDYSDKTEQQVDVTTNGESVNIPANTQTMTEWVEFLKNRTKSE